MIVCTVAAVINFLGYMPPRGTVITVPKSRIVELSPPQKARAEACARKYGIAWVVDEAR